MRFGRLNTVDLSSNQLQVPKLSTRKILSLLYIEDDPDIQATVKLALESFSPFKVVTTHHQNAIKLAFKHPWDFFLLEVATSTGISLTTYYQIKEHSKTRSIPIILLTSRVMSDELAYLQQLDIAGIIPKPFNPIELGKQIVALL